MKNKIMNKKGILVFIAGFGLVLIGAVPYYSGYFIKQKVFEVVDMLNQYTAHQVDMVSYSRGWRHSTVVMKVAISDLAIKTLCPVSVNSSDLSSKTKDYILIQHHFTHGPLVKILREDKMKWVPAHAMVDSKILGFEGKDICPAMKDLEKQKDNWYMHGQIALNGDLSAQIDEKAFDYNNKELGFKLKSEGGEIKLKLDNKSKHFSMNGAMPYLYLEMPKFNMIITSKELMVNVERNYEEKIWSGDSHYIISHFNLSFNKPDGLKDSPIIMEFNKINMGDVTKLNNHLVDVSVNVNVDWLKVGESQYGPVNLLLSVNKLTPDFYRKIMESWLSQEKKSRNSTGGGIGDVSKDIQDEMEQIKKLLPAVLQNEPELALNKLFIKTPQGEFLLNAKMKIGGEGATDIDKMDKIIASIRAMKHAEVDESLMRDIIKQYFDAMAKTAPATLWAQAQTTPEQWVPVKVEEMINKIVSMGFLVRKDNKLMMDVTFDKMQTLINGKPLMMPTPDMFKTDLPQPVPVPVPVVPMVVEPTVPVTK